MKKDDIDTYLQQGIFGATETKPDERNRYLGSLRERVIIALTKKQVREKGTYKEIEHLMSEYPKAQLLLNGKMAYQVLSDYTKLANKMGFAFKVVTNKSSKTDLGLVLVSEHAIEMEQIYIDKDSQTPEKTDKRLTFFERLFKRNK